MKRMAGMLVLLLALTACQQPVMHEHRQTLFGIDHHLQIVDPDPARAKRAIEAVFFELSLMTKNAQPRVSNSMRRTNSLLRTREWFSVNPSLVDILTQAARYERLSGGRYNPAALGGLRALWGFYQKDGATTVPTDKALRELLDQRPSMGDIEFSDIRVRSNNDSIRVDFDQLILGYAIDLQIDHLRQLGIRNARLSIGNVERVIGQAEHGPWHTSHGFGASGRTLPLADGEAGCRRATADHARNAGGITVNDVLDATTGRPVTHARAAQVIAANASLASVACWSLLIAGPANWQAAAAQLGIGAAALVDADGNWQLSPALRQRLDRGAQPWADPGQVTK